MNQDIRLINNKNYNLKRLFHFAAFVLIACTLACNNSADHTAKDDAASDQPEGLTLITNSDCGTCHNATVKVVGPAYKDIAAKYPSTPENISKLADEVLKGNSGVWSNIPMTSHAGLEKKDVEKMVGYILSLKDIK